MKIAYVTDTGIGKPTDSIPYEDCFVIPLQIADNEINYQDMDEMTIEKCLEELANKKVLKTSLPSLAKIEDLFRDIKNSGYDAIVAVPICSGLSGTIDAIQSIANQLEIDCYIVDTHVTAVVQEYILLKIREWINLGESKEVIEVKVKEIIDSCNTLLVPDDMQHFKRGGRLTPIAAALSELLGIKPILVINQDTQGRIDIKEKVRTFTKAMNICLDITKKAVDSSYLITIAHVGDADNANTYAEKLRKELPDVKVQVIKLCNVVAVHSGLRCLAIQYFKMVE